MDDSCIDSFHYKGSGERYTYRTQLPKDSEPRWWHFTLMHAENVIMRVGHTVSNKTIIYDPGGFLWYRRTGDSIVYVKDFGMRGNLEGAGGIEGYAHQAFMVRKMSVYGVNFIVEAERATDTGHDFVQQNMSIREPFLEYSLSSSYAGTPAFEAETSFLYYNDYDLEPEEDVFLGYLILQVPVLANRMKLEGWQWRQNDGFEPVQIIRSDVAAMMMVRANASFTQEQFANMIVNDPVNNFEPSMMFSDSVYSWQKEIGRHDVVAPEVAGFYFELLDEIKDVKPGERIWSYVGSHTGVNRWLEPRRNTFKNFRLLWSYKPESGVL